jgi:transposase
MTSVGIDTHKATLAACAVDELGSAVAEQTFRNDRAGHEALEVWVRTLRADVIGLEGSSGYGAAAARHLVSRGFSVREVPPHLSHRERIATRRPGKSDPGDALAIARVTARERMLPPVRIADASEDLGLLVQARDELVAEETQVRNRLHADLVVLMPGYGARVANLVAVRNRKLIAAELASLPGIRSELARARLGRLDEIGRVIRRLEVRLAVLLGDHPLLSVPGIRALTAAKLIAETGDVRRFRSADAFAMLAGTAPIPASSGQTDRVRLNRGGNRQLNRALHMVALAQANHHAEGKSYVARKRAEGKTWREAIRALKRHLARVVFRVMRRAALAVPLAA